LLDRSHGSHPLRWHSGARRASPPNVPERPADGDENPVRTHRPLAPRPAAGYPVGHDNRRRAMGVGVFSVAYAGLRGQAAIDPRAFVRKAAELGFDAVMLAGKRPHLSPLDADEAALAILRDELRTAGVRCAAVAAYTDLGAAAAAEVPVLEMQIAYVESLCRIGARLGAGVVRAFTAYEAAGAGPYALWQRVVTGLREMCDRA